MEHNHRTKLLIRTVRQHVLKQYGGDYAKAFQAALASDYWGDALCIGLAWESESEDESGLDAEIRCVSRTLDYDSVLADLDVVESKLRLLPTRPGTMRLIARLAREVDRARKEKA